MPSAMSTTGGSTPIPHGHYNGSVLGGPSNHVPPHAPEVSPLPNPPNPMSSAPFSVSLPHSMPIMGSVGTMHHQPPQPQQQPHQQQYPGINSIPGMHSMGQMNNVHALPAVSAVQSFSTLPAINNIAPILPPPNDSSNGGGGLVSNHVASHFSSGLLSGAVDKRRGKGRKGSNNVANVAYTTEDPNVIVGATHGAGPMDGHNGTEVPQQNNISPSTPAYEADGIQFKILSQLPDMKIQRLRSEKIKPIESLTFSDIKAYNRNQLRAYCSVYGIRRKKKAEMERDMARYAALFHPNEPEYDVAKFEPTEYADGPIPRRKVPVTKEQKEKAAGDFKQLTNALHQRPSFSSPNVRNNHRYSSTTVRHVNSSIPNGNTNQSQHIVHHSHIHGNNIHDHQQHVARPHSMNGNAHTVVHPPISASRLNEVHVGQDHHQQQAIGSQVVDQQQPHSTTHVTAPLSQQNSEQPHSKPVGQSQHPQQQEAQQHPQLHQTHQVHQNGQQHHQIQGHPSQVQMHHQVQQMPPHSNGVHTQNGFTHQVPGHSLNSRHVNEDPNEHGATVTPSELMTVPDMHVSHQLLSISHQIGEE